MFPFDLFSLWLNVSIITLKCHKRIKYKHLNDSHHRRTVEESNFLLYKLVWFRHSKEITHRINSPVTTSRRSLSKVTVTVSTQALVATGSHLGMRQYPRPHGRFLSRHAGVAWRRLRRRLGMRNSPTDSSTALSRFARQKEANRVACVASVS